nr:MAG TPA: hypothetical protein [Caudoviricetes sp.]
MIVFRTMRKLSRKSFETSACHSVCDAHPVA